MFRPPIAEWILVRSATASIAAIACAGLLAGCASLPEQGSVGSAKLPRMPYQIGQEVPASEHAGQVAVDPNADKPLDGKNLPPFDGEKHEIREPLRGVATVDLTVQPDDLWKRIRAGFSMPILEDKMVQERTAWYAARPDYLKRMFERSRLYLYHIVEELEKRGMPTELALLPMVESSFNPMAYSRSHASGLWQFIPGTGKRYDLTQNWWYDGRRDIVASTSAALDYLKDIYEMNGDWHLALASYNWGEHAVAKAIERNKAAGLSTDYSSLRMPKETRYYVPKLQALKNIIANPAPFGIVLDPIPNQPYFATVTRERDMDIRLAAQLAEMPVEAFLALNPAFNRPIIPASVNARLVLPADKVEVFHANLQKYDKGALVSWKTYQPKRGEKLSSIARRFGVSVAQLRRVNGISARTRHLPGLLVVPIHSGNADAQARLPLIYAPPTPLPAGRTQVHSVRSGETLSSIASRYRVTVADLRIWNSIGKGAADRISIGQELRIHSNAPRARSASTNKIKPHIIKDKKKSLNVKKKVRK